MHEKPAVEKPFARWLGGGGPLGDRHAPTETHPWYLVLWLTGVDYFSTLGYQPGIALLAAGALAPLSTGILVAVTLFGALPVYCQVAARSYAGQGSIAMLENLLPGWAGKLFVLVLLGFAGTDFVITMTLSAADAAQHAIENPYLHPYLGEHRIYLTLGLLARLSAVFLKGFREAIDFAVVVAVPYLLLNLVVLLRGAIEIARRPELISAWSGELLVHGDWTALLIMSALMFPRLALGLSGFVTTLLIPADAVALGGPAYGRAIAYLAHQFLGNKFGTVYDMATITILWFAGASAMAGLISLVPRYLPRFGMAPQWVSYRRPLVILLFAITVIITLVFQADVQAQAGAYATGVLMLMLSAGVAVALALWHEARRVLSIYFWIVSAIFAFALVDNVIERPDGPIIACVFIAIMLVMSAISRYLRSTELRVSEVTFADSETVLLWKGIVGKKVNLAPLRTNTPEARDRKAAEIREHYEARGPLGFIHVKLLDNRSEFLSPIQLRVWKERDDYVIEVHGAIAIANTIACVSELVDPISIFLGLTRQNLMSQSLRFLLLGEGETGLIVYAILVKYWKSTPEDDVRPLIFLMSECSGRNALRSGARI